MPQSSELSINDTEQDHISKNVAIALLKQVLKDEQIDEDVAKQIIEHFIKNMEDSFKNPEIIEEVRVRPKPSDIPGNARLRERTIRLMGECVPPHCGGGGDPNSVIE
ncbi:MAG: hypothetical protein ACRCU2_28460 [Planktothrix sp.]